MKKRLLVSIIYLCISAMFILTLTGCETNQAGGNSSCNDSSNSNSSCNDSSDNSSTQGDVSHEPVNKKPVIYLYPTTEQKVSVKLNYKGKLTCTYPQYNNGWEVIAQPNGTLTNISDNREYSYLYWEGVCDNTWDMSKGFVVKGDETAAFLQEKLEYMGLTPKEYNEFIVYWLPILQENKYNQITFAGQDYETIAPLEINPKPDSMLRIMMLFKPLNEPVDIQEQQLQPFTRNGFTVVEWGGTEVK